MKYRELCSIEDIPSRTDAEILLLWSSIQSDDAEWDEDWFRALCHETWKARSLSPTIDTHKGEFHFTVLDEDLRTIDQLSLDPWVQPDTERRDFSYILCYAQTFAGYEYAERAGIDLGKMANDCADEYYRTKTLPTDFVSLRCCLFFEIRRQRLAGLREENWRYIQDLFKAVGAAYAAEAPSRPARLAEFNRELQARLDSLDRGEYVTSEEFEQELREKSVRRRTELEAARRSDP
ncbi:MAG TPA: hypothetical protein VMD29_00735 [Terracidiphilus sp.]|nr:hypothetical protein [Terracidiphilus sp.]